MLAYCGLGFGFGLSLTLVGYLVDYYTLYKTLPEALGLGTIQGLHRVTPVHFFTDAFAPILAAVGAVAGRLHDQLRYHSNHLEEIVAARTEDLRRSQERYELAARGSNDGLWDWDLVTGAVYYSPRWKQALGLAEADVAATPEAWFERVHPEDRPGLEARIESHLAGGTEHLVAEYRARHADGSYRWMLSRGVAVREEARATPYRFAGSQSDVDERKKMEEQLMHLALHDPLTDLPNRPAFNQCLSQTLDEANKTKEPFALLSLDLDRFSEINDVFGHGAGDALLREVSRRLNAAAEGAFLARLGGDEFALIVCGEQPTAAAQLADRLLATVTEPLVVGDRRLQIGLTIGIAVCPNDGTEAASLISNADAALHRAKTAGRGSYRFFEADMDQRLRERRALVHDLRLAIERGEIAVHYQPQARIDGATTGFEALVRWAHPARGMIPPSEFIPVAEESGLILQLGEWILREVAREAASWPRPLNVAINLSPVQFRHGDLPGLVHTVLLDSGLAPDRLELEITEGVLIDDLPRALAILRRLKLLGVRIAMDDFGTGYSSLSNLQAFPFDKIKIDRSFISNLETNPQSATIVRAVIGLGKGLDLPVVAEGVETREQLAFLAKEDCAEVQGYLIGKPQPIAAYAKLIGRRALHAAVSA